METNDTFFLYPCVFSRSYRTYEEWKHYIVVVYSYSPWQVLTVPMRNGNSLLPCPGLRYESVLTVPMRNGNKKYSKYYQFIQKVLTVPMRNGNLQRFFSSSIA